MTMASGYPASNYARNNWMIPKGFITLILNAYGGNILQAYCQYWHDYAH